jgi:glutamine amidotransferase-like uncharacterized protein
VITQLAHSDKRTEILSRQLNKAQLIQTFRILQKLVLATALLSSAHVMSQTIAIFNGAGTCEGCGESVGKLFQQQHHQVIYLNENTLNSKVLKAVDVYVQPGGSDDIDETLNALKPEQVDAIRDFVKSGGHYLGICAGAYLAAQYSSKADNQKAFGLVALAELSAETDYTYPSLLQIQWDSKSRRVYNQSGPHLGNKVPANSKVLATYKASGRIAALLSHYGQGRVLLIGPHLEADHRWYEEDGLETHHGYNLALFYEAIAYLQ